MKENNHNYTITLTCRCLGLSKSGYYAWLNRVPSKRSQENEALKLKIKSIHNFSRGTYGLPRVYEELKKQGFEYSLSRVRRLRKNLGLRVRRRKKFIRTTDSNHNLPVAPNLLNRNFHTSKENQAWVSDITYIRTEEGWLYLAVVIDLYSRRVVGWSLQDQMSKTLVLDALEMAINCLLYTSPSPRDRG